MAKQSEQTRAERTAALMKQQQQAERRRQITIVSAIVAVLAVIVGVGIWLMNRSEKPAKVDASAYALTIGDSSAPTKVVIYEDFLCPACGYFESISRDKLAAAADAGKVQVEYRPFYFLNRKEFEDYSLKAANAFRAVWVQVGPEAAKTFHDSLFDAQPSESGPFPDDSFFIDKAVAAGADEAKIRPAIEKLEYKSWVTKATDEATNVPITATPSVFLNGKLIEAGTLDEMATKLFTAIG